MANSSAPVDHYANPYFLHSSDHAGMNIISDRLTSGADFYSWKRLMRIALNVRNKLGFVDGKIPKPPEDHQDYGSWSRCNDMITTWIINSVDKKIGGSLLYISTAEEIWNNLMSRFKQDDAPKVYELEQKLNSLQQGSMDVTSYYTMLVTLWEEYKNYVELPVCTCGKCECSAATLWEKLQQRSRVTNFLMGLNASYESTRRHILMLKPIPSIEEVFNMVTSDERQTNITPKPNNMIFQASTSTEVPVSVSSQASGTHQAPYTGYILGFKSSFANYQGTQGSQRPVMSSAQPRGFTPSNPRPVTHAVANVITETSPAPSMTPTVNLDINTMSSEHITSLIQQLNAKVKLSEAPASSSQASSITEHGVMAVQSSSVTVSGVTVSLPNEDRVDITHCGSVLLSSSLILHDVLHESIQGLMIGKGFLLHNLYILQLDASSSALTASSSSSLPHFTGSLKVDGHLWHQRLGHPSSDKLKILSAKQKRIPFESNNHLSSQPFALIHLDIWGPFSVTSKDRHKFSPRADQCVFLGYSFGYKGYKVLHLESNVISITRNIIFHEEIFPFKLASNTLHSPDIFDSVILPLSPPLSSVIDPHYHPHHHALLPSSSITSSSSHSHQPSVPSTNDSVPETVPTEMTIVSSLKVRPKRTSKVPGYLSDYHCSLTQISPPSSSSTFTTPYPISSYITYTNFKPSHQAFLLSVSTETEPKNFQQAIAYVYWTKAMNVEMDSMNAAGTFDVVSLPRGKNVVGCKWVYTDTYGEKHPPILYQYQRRKKSPSG
ncbi:PREDICTED: uncharacterized protein LOC104759868 [Camelina sativa]|uniref:Uncharacterized protein LOC104759868 n=1 Tax=Camelina sativa TaxID=90675 RepID=A0ABM0X5J7_CAMSA|nr:PREDICTED: uncharacterized protein LOC104759868 [Camelina sativa]